MSDYYYNTGGQGPRRGGRATLLSYFLVALIGAMIGGLLVVTVAPGYLMDRVPHIGFPGGGAPGGQPPILPDDGTPGDGAAVGAIPGTVPYAAERVGPAVVGIINKAVAYDAFRRPYTEQRSGSGVIFHPDGYIVTNSHVVEGATELLVNLADGSTLTGHIVGDDPFTDLAVIKVDADGLPVAEFGDSEALIVGELAVAIGNPVGLEFARSVTAGVISGLDRRIQHGDRFFVVVQTDAAINPGNSGGPLVNGLGQVIGINTIKYAAQGIEGMGFAIPINTVRPLVNELLLHGRVVRPWLGVRIAGREDAARYGVEVDRGVLIVEVISGGPAQSAGLRNADVVIQIGDRAVNSVAELTEAIQAHRVGDRISVVVLRRGSELTYRVTLGEMRM